MKNSIRAELLEHVIDHVEYTDADFDFSELHNSAFNEDYYIIGYYNAEQWLEKHEVSAFEAIADVIEWENNVLGEVQLNPEDMNAEKIVNLYVYVLGEELLSEFNTDLEKDELLTELRAAI